MKPMRKMVKRSLLLATLAVLAALTMAGVNPQAYSAPANVAVSNTAEGYVLVRWEYDGGPIHRVGWTQETELRAAQAAGDWLEAFHFADTGRATDYTVKYLPGGQLYWFIVGTGGERFGPVTWGEWNSLTTVGSTPPSQPTTIPTPVEEPDDAVKDGGTLLMSAYADTRDWDPVGSASLSSVIAYSQLYNQLVQYDTVDTSAIVGDLAESWDVSADGRTYTFHLRDGMRWNDGRTIAANDVVTSLARYANPCNSTGRSGLWRNYTVRIEVVEFADKADCTPTNQDAVLRVVNSNTVQINLGFPSPAFIKFLALDYVKVLPAHLLDAGVNLNDPRAVLERQATSGPFVLEDYQEGDFYKVDKNPNYFKEGRPFVDRIEHFIITDTSTLIAQFEAGRLELANGGFTNLSPTHYFDLEKSTDGEYVAHPIAAGTNWGLMLNIKKPQFQDTLVRQAINLAVDRQEVDERVFDNSGGSYCPLMGLAHTNEECNVWPGIRPKSTAGGQQDLKDARALMAQAGYPDGFEVQYTVRQVGNYSEQCRMVKWQLESALGIVGDIEVLPSAAGYAKYGTSRPEGQEGDWEIACQGEGVAIYDPDAVYGGFYLKGGTRNYTDWSHSNVDAWFEAQKVELNPAARRNINRQAERWLHEFSDNHWVTLQLGQLYWLVHRDVKGFNSPQTVHYGFKHEDLWLDR